jgi:hypothetical protein
MKNLIKVVSVVAAAAFVLVSTVAVLTPRVVRAVTAELVQNVDSPPRNPWMGTCNISPVSSGIEGFADCQISVTAGQELVIQTITFTGYATNHTHMLLTLGCPGCAASVIRPVIGVSELPLWNNQIDAIVSSPALAAGINAFASTFPCTIYYPGPYAGSEPPAPLDLSIQTNANNPVIDGFSLEGTFTLFGYAVNVGTPKSSS